MRRILWSLPALALAAFIIGCGSDNSGPAPTASSLASLNGQYFFHEQYYTYDGINGSVAASGKLSGGERKTGGIFARPALRTKASVAKARPASGSLNSTVAAGEAVGSLTFDGAGNISAGTIDVQEPLYGGYYSANVTGAYTVDTTGAGTIQINIPGGSALQFSFAVTGGITGSAASNAKLLENTNDAQLEFVEIGTGSLDLQTSTATTGNYVFGLRGQTCYGCTSPQSGDVSAAGVLAFDGSGNITSASTGDFATGFATDNGVALTGTYTTPNSAGRSTATLTATGYANGLLPQSYVIYVIDSDHIFILDTDASTTSTAAGLLYGPAQLQSGTFTNATLSGNYISYEVKEDVANEQSGNADGYADASLGLLNADGTVIAGTLDVDAGGNVQSGIAVSYPYSVASNGRVTFSGTEPGGAAAPVLWLVNSSMGYATEQPNSNELTEAGLITFIQQSSTTVATTGTYSVGTIPAATSQATYVLGVAPASTTGLSGGEGYAAALNGSATGNASATLSLDSSGRGTFTPGSGSELNSGIAYAVSSTEYLVLDETSGDVSPTIQIVQQ